MELISTHGTLKKHGFKRKLVFLAGVKAKNCMIVDTASDHTRLLSTYRLAEYSCAADAITRSRSREFSTFLILYISLPSRLKFSYSEGILLCMHFI